MACFADRELLYACRDSRQKSVGGGGPHSLDRFGPWIRWSWDGGPRDPIQGSRAATNQFTVWVPFGVASFWVRHNGDLCANASVASAACIDLCRRSVAESVVDSLVAVVVEGPPQILIRFPAVGVVA